ncbi:MAG: transketolase [Candidatus Nealsonbacteria bacterium]
MTQNKAEIEKNIDLAKELRIDVLDMIYKTKSPHIGSSLSMVDIFVALYSNILNINPENPSDKNRDRLLLSKGHGCATLFAVLAKKGFINKEDLDSFAKDGSFLGQHPNMDIKKGIELTSGSLGHGLSIGAGIALAGKYDKEKYRTFVYLGDGEINEGSVWEAALFASHYGLDNLIAIIDRNKLQALGKGEDIMNLEPLADKWKSFGWGVKEIDGHNIEEIVSVLESIPFETGKPTCIIANTVKGKGFSFMENDFRWHDKCPNEEEYQKALKELQ